MSIPHIDPDFTMADLRKAGDKLLAAAYEYWEASHKAGIRGAVIWLADTDGKMVLFTRGEYRQTILQNVHGIGAAREFGAIAPEE